MSWRTLDTLPEGRHQAGDRHLTSTNLGTCSAFSFDDVILSLRLSGPTDTTLPMVILSMAQRRPSPELDAIGAVVIMIGIVCVGAATLAMRIRRVGEKHSVIGGL